MARIRYTGKEEKRIPGLGPIGAEWTPCPDHIAEEFRNEPGFDVEVGAGFKPDLTTEPVTNKEETKTGGKKS